MSWPAVALAALAVLPATAHAWGSEEHRFQGEESFRLGVLESTAPRREMNRLLEQYRYTVGLAAEVPDFCHSYWHSPVPQRASVACHSHFPNLAEDCAIREGVPSGAGGASAATGYVLSTNENHFGDHTYAHWRHWHALALEAAMRYRVTGNRMCERLATSIDGFGLHYAQDRTASGHAWTQNSSGFLPRPGLAEAFKDIRRTCIHSQHFHLVEGLLAIGLEIGTQALELSQCATPGIGEMNTRMGDALWFAGEWQNDDRYFEGVSLQREYTDHEMLDSVREIVDTMQCGPLSGGTFAPRPSFVSNLHFCRAVLQECCYGDTFGVLCERCADGAVGVTGSRIREHCPYTDLGLGFVPVDEYQVRVGIRVVQLDDPGWAAELTTASRSLWAGGGGVHPDAAWDAAGAQILDRAGCGMTMAPGAPHRTATCDDWPCDFRPVVYCDDTRPVDMLCGEPCGKWLLHTDLVDGECHCPDVVGDGVCATERGESFLSSSDCGPRYCGDGYCDLEDEDEDTCPADCLEQREGDGFCALDDRPDSHPVDCGAPSPRHGFPCEDHDGGFRVIREQREQACGPGRGYSCQICPEATPPANLDYRGTEQAHWPNDAEGLPQSCLTREDRYLARFFSSHECENMPCVTIEDGGWCDGVCDPSREPTNEGCIPRDFMASGMGGPTLPFSDPAEGATFEMLVVADGRSDVTNVQAANYITTTMMGDPPVRTHGFDGQDTYEVREAGVGSSTLLRQWRAAAPASQTIFTIAPAVPHPITLVPSATRMVVSRGDSLNGLATFPDYAQILLPCLDDPPEGDPPMDGTFACLNRGGMIVDAGADAIVGGEMCRQMMFGGVTVCVPYRRDLRSTLYPLRIESPPGPDGMATVEFRCLEPADIPASVFTPPGPCRVKTIAGMFAGEYCDLP